MLDLELLELWRLWFDQIYYFKMFNNLSPFSPPDKFPIYTPLAYYRSGSPYSKNLLKPATNYCICSFTRALCVDCTTLSLVLVFVIAWSPTWVETRWIVAYLITIYFAVYSEMFPYLRLRIHFELFTYAKGGVKVAVFCSALPSEQSQCFQTRLM
jgi:hypothetical protein